VVLEAVNIFLHIRSQLARMGEKRSAFGLLVGKPAGGRPLGRPRRMWVDNIKVDLGDKGWGSVDWISLPRDSH
jgi:hypothetical protein